MSPTYKLTYFEVRGLAEPIRYLLHHAAVQFEDVRIPMPITSPENAKNWEEMKKTLPWGVLPTLEEDGKLLSQSSAILRYLGKKYGLAPDNEWDLAKCDEYLDAITDARLEVAKAYFAPDDKELVKKVLEVTLPTTLGKFNTILKNNGSGYLVGDKLTYVDIFVAYFPEQLCTMPGFEGKFANYPELVDLNKRVANLKGIKEWIRDRPVTQF